jgi:Alginate export
MSVRLVSCAGLMFLFVMSGSVLAEEPEAAPQSNTAPTPAPAPPPALKLGPLDVTVNWRARAEHWDWFQGPTGNSNYTFGDSLLRVAIGQKTDRIDWQVEAAQVAILGLPDNAVVAAPQGQLGLGANYYAANGNSTNNGSAFVKQAFAQLKQLGPTNLKVGRFEFFDGAEARPADPTVATLVQTRITSRLISNFAFSVVQRTYDGAQFSWNDGPSNVTAFAARPTEGVFQVDGMGELDVEVYYGAFNRSIKTGNGEASLRVFGVGYIDGRTTVLKTDNRPTAVRAADHGEIKIGTYGADYVQSFHTGAGTFDVLGWGAIQTGAWGSLTQDAGAFVGEFGWQPPTDVLKPWLSAGYSYGSGDGNPNDSRHGTFFQVLTTPRQFARFPFYNMMNNEDVSGTLDLRPASKLSLRSEVHGLRLASASDLWYSGGGAFQSSTFGYTGRPSNGSQSLATVWDVSADYRLTRFLSATLYYGHASGQGTISTIYPKDSRGQLAYVETNVHF